jgi:hypothetical protein
MKPEQGLGWVNVRYVTSMLLLRFEAADDYIQLVRWRSSHHFVTAVNTAPTRAALDIKLKQPNGHKAQPLQ